ncbi:MAG TPA: FG-GAP-like repeat-containing protein [Baekduia sp.]|nr:FG-GAP-like repeat-containing protein [Baekduia sp.]
MPLRRPLVLGSLLALLLAGPAAAAQAPDYVDLTKRKLLPLQIAVPGAVAGSALATGDFNGDGADDLAVGAHGASPADRVNAGAAEVLYGPITGGRPKGRLLILGPEPGARAGIALADVGDITGDGISDLAVGASQASPEGRTTAGVVRIVPGGATGVYDMARGDLPGFSILGAAPADNAGRALAGIGDQDGDEIPDMLVGAPGVDAFGRVRAGAAYVVRGGTLRLRSVDLAAASGAAQRFGGAAEGAVTGYAVAGGGDRDGDDVPDFAIGAPEDQLRAGRVYVVTGGLRSAGVDLAGAAGGIVRVTGERPGYLFGFSLADLGDFNGDGLSDLAAGAWGASPRDRRSAGQVFVLTKDPTRLRPTILGAATRDRLGRAVAAAGDVDSDGRADLLAGASSADLGDAEYAGAVAIVPARKRSTFDLDDFVTRIALSGTPRQTRLGDALAGDADLDGDGRVDAALGAPGAGGMSKRGGVLLVPNPYPVDLDVERVRRSWCAAGRLRFSVRLDGAASVRGFLTSGVRRRQLRRSLPAGFTELSFPWAGRSSAAARLQVRATGRDGRRVQRTVRVPAGC